MSDAIAISVRNVSKRFVLFRSPLERLLAGLPFRRRQPARDFWALRDVSFDVPRSTTVGILGRNGSGKSTLLQLLYSVLQPTTGSVTCRGSTSALLELGAGFNPAFTGRANILLHGVTRGLSPSQVEAKLPEIEAFAEIGPFIDQPVKTYSSGMFVRLAFAAAISDDPDIFLVDEALAVGDARFQHKCYQKFLDFQQAGKTILLVTHDTQAVVKHCQHALLLDNGRLIGRGEPREIVNHYLELLFTGTVGGYRPVPKRVRQGYKGFNIVHHGSKFYGLADCLGPLDLAEVGEQQLDRLAKERKCVIGESLQAAKQLVDRIDFERREDRRRGHAQDKAPGQGSLDQAPVEQFLEAPVDARDAARRRSYNAHEHRIGDHRGEIVDYLIMYGDETDPAIIAAGSVADIYVKARFHQEVERPVFGIALKTLDGLTLYGINTPMKRVWVDSVRAADVLVVKFTLPLPLPPGDYFLDLGLAEAAGGEHLPLDVRYDLIHLHVQQQEPFSGLVNLGVDVQEVYRTSTTATQEECLGA
jgi:ABC-type polysaccharide/polyol phosphate transport system ATPase subunit